MTAFEVTIKRRQELLLDAFTARRVKGVSHTQTPLAIFVKKLQESLTRMESCEVVTVAQGADGTYARSHLSANQLTLPRLETQFSLAARPPATAEISSR